ncbi:MAG: hypothetical protein LC634_08350 [Sphingomonadales bacterium]|nr:hypothetical protein [Sphingomonadales bacterium]
MASSSSAPSRSIIVRQHRLARRRIVGRFAAGGEFELVEIEREGGLLAVAGDRSFEAAGDVLDRAEAVLVRRIANRIDGVVKRGQGHRPAVALEFLDPADEIGPDDEHGVALQLHGSPLRWLSASVRRQG